MNKKRIYFLIGAILTIIFSIVSILGADASREATLEMLNTLPSTLHDRMASIYSSNAIIIIPSVFCIVFSVIILILCFRSLIESKKNWVIGLSIATFLFSSNFIVTILAIVNIILAATIKGESVRKEKRNVPNMERYDTGYKGVIGAVICLAIYFSQLFIPSANNLVLNYVIIISFYIIVLGVCLFIFKDNLKRDFASFKENYREYFSFILPKLGIIYIIYMVASFICILVFNQGVSVNQQQIESLPLWFTLPLAILWAPIVEEILFRGCIRRFVKGDKIYVIVSGLIFGLLHTIGEETLVGALVMMVPYGVLGGGFAYIYSKTNNITNNMLCHSFHNTLAMLLQILLFF